MKEHQSFSNRVPGRALPSNMFSEVVDLALRSVELRLATALGFRPTPYADEWRTRDTPFVELNDGVRFSMTRLGRRFRGTGLDLRECSMWESLEAKDAYVRAFEFLRPVELLQVTPTVIYEHLMVRHNIIRWEGYSARITCARETTDDYGCPTWDRNVRITTPRGETTHVSRTLKSSAREVFRALTGLEAPTDDGLGFDWPHPAEGIPSWLVEEDGSVITSR